MRPGSKLSYCAANNIDTFQTEPSSDPLYGKTVFVLYLCGNYNTPLRMLRLSLPQNGSILGTSSPSAVEQGLWSGDEGMGGTWSCGDLELLGGGEVEEGGGEEVVGVGV